MSLWTHTVYQPIYLKISAHVDAVGQFTAFDGVCDDDLSVFDEARLVRAVQFCAASLQKARSQGYLISDLIGHLPQTDEFAVELSILRPIAQLQGEILAGLMPSQFRWAA